MSRQPRLTVPGMPMHITQRGTDRMPTFLDPDDFASYLACLRYASERHRCAIHAYVLMTNHVHLLVTPSDVMSASRLMQTLGRMYVRRFNERYHRTGALWEGRFRSAVVETRRYFLACSRYIDLNPVRAGLVGAAEDYAWSSFASLALGQPDPVLQRHAEVLALGRTATERAEAYRAMCTPDTARDSALFIRHTTERGGIIGTAAARAELARELGCPAARLAHGGVREGAGRPPTARTSVGSAVLPASVG